MQPAPVRRSGRAPKPNPRYEDEVPWNDDTLRLLRADSDTSNESSTPESSLAQQDADPDDPDIEMGDTEMADIDMEDAAEDEEDYIVEQTQHVPVEPSTPRPTPSPPLSPNDLPVRQKAKHTKTSFRMARKEMYPHTFGPDLEDLYPVLQSRDLWHLNPRDLVFPSRSTLKEVLRLDAKGEYLERKQEDISSHVPPNHQQVEEITRDEAIAERYLEIGESHDVVLGPPDAGQKHTFEHYQPFQIAQAWPKPSADGTSTPDTPVLDDAYHKGWILNLGARPQCLVWAPSTTHDQFLAVTSRCSKPQRDTAPPRESKLAPAFSPSPAYASRIEIWRFKAKPESDEEPAQLDHHTPPQLVQVLCTRYGNVLKMEWLPMANTSQHSICILTSDGNVRIVNLDLVDRDFTLYLDMKQPQFIANPPSNTIFTSFSIPTPHDLIAADAAGAIHLFSLLSDSPTLTPYSTLQIHMTYITAIASIPSHPQYICTSSAAGEYILTDLRSPTIDRVRLQSARVPTRNLAYLPFTRTFLTTLDSASRYESVAFHGSVVVSHSLRDFKTQKPILRLPEIGGVTTCLATSEIHPVILVGNMGGTVFACNYLRRCLPIGNAKKDKVGAWMVRVFGYEWRGLMGKEVEERGKKRKRGDETVSSAALPAADGHTMDVSLATATSDTELPPHDPSSTPATQQNSQQGQEQDPIDLYHGPSKPEPGISRFTEGYIPEKVVVSNLDTARSSGKSTFNWRTKAKAKAEAKSKSESKSKAKGRPEAKSKDTATDEEEDDYMDAEGGQDGVAGSGGGEAEAEAAGGDNGMSSVIYHEEQAVTSIAWNGSPRFASWIAVAWGSGLVRICDLGHDVV